MKTRTEKWKNYRDKILQTPDDKFPPHKENFVHRQSHADQLLVNSSAVSTAAITYDHLSLKKKKKVTPYAEYAKKKNILLVVKLASFFVALVILVVAYFLWVR